MFFSKQRRDFKFLLLLGVFFSFSVYSQTPSPQNSPRQQALQIFHLTSWRFSQTFQALAPELLWHRYQESQLALAPYADCTPGPLDKSQLGTEALKSALETAQEALKTYLELKKEELFKLSGKLRQDKELEKFRNEFLSTQASQPPVLVSGSYRCLPNAGFAPPQKWTGPGASLSNQQQKMEEYEQLLKSGLDYPIAVQLEFISDSARLSDEELYYWLNWLSLLRKLYVDFASTQAHQLTATAPAFILPTKLGKDLSEFLLYKSRDTAEGALGLPKKDSRLNATELAEKILDATLTRQQTPHFVPCQSNQWCFADPELPPETALADKITRSLHSPHMTLGTYMDGLVAFGKQAQIQELTFTNLLLPNALKKKELPAACFSQNSTVMGQSEFQGLKALFDRYSHYTKRQWWVQHLTTSAENLALNIQHRKIPLLFPVTAQPIEWKGTKATLYKHLDALVLEWFKALTTRHQEQAERLGNKWAEIEQEVKSRLEAYPFETYLKDQQGLAEENDFNTALAENILVLFGTASPTLSDSDQLNSLNEKAWRDLPEPFLLDAVKAAVIAAGSKYLKNFLTYQDFSQNNLVKFFDGGALNALALWDQEFYPQWRAFIESYGSARDSEIKKLTKTLKNQLEQTAPYEDVLNKKIQFEPEKISQKIVQERLSQSKPFWEKATRAEETLKYLDEVQGMKNDLARNFLPGSYLTPFNYSYIADHLPKDVGPVCLNIHTSKGIGVALLGDLKPGTEEDWLDFKKVLANIAERKEKELTKLLKEQVDEATLKTYGLSTYEKLSRQIIRRWNYLLEAKPGLEPVYVGKIRAEMTEPLLKSLNDYATAKAKYNAFTKQIADSLYRYEIEPLLRQNELTPENRTYIEKHLKQLAASQILLPGKETLSIELVEKAEQQSGAKELQNTSNLLNELRNWDTISKSFFLGKPKHQVAGPPSQMYYTESYSDAVKTKPEFLKEKNQWVLDSLKSNAGRKLFEARAADFLPEELEKFANSKNLALADTTEALELLAKSGFTKAYIVSRAWLGAALPMEMQNHWTKAGGFQEKAVEEPLTQILKTLDPNSDEAKIKKAALEDLNELLKKRTERARSAYKSIDAFLEELAQQSDLSKEGISLFVHEYFQKHSEIYDAFIETQVELIDFFNRYINAKDDEKENELIQLSYIVFQTLHSRTLGAVLSRQNLLAEIKSQPGQALDQYLAERLFAPYETVRVKLLEQLAYLRAPGTDPFEDLIQLDKQIDTVENLQHLIVESGKQSEIEKIKRELNRLIIRRAELTKQREVYAKASVLLAYISPAFKEAVPVAQALGNLKEETYNLEKLFETYLIEPQTIALTNGSTVKLSAKQILDDLNSITKRTGVTYPVDIATAKSFLEDIENYAKAATQPLNKNLVEKWMEKTVADTKAHLKLPAPYSTLARQRLDSYRAILHSDLQDEEYPSAMALLQDFAYEAKKLNKKLSALKDNQVPEELQSAYWLLVERVSHLFFSETTAFTTLYQEKDARFTPVFFRSSPLLRDLHVREVLSKKYTPNPIVVGVTLARLSEQPGLDLEKIFPSKDPNQSSIEWISNLDPQERYALYSDAGNKIKDALNKNEDWVRSLIKNWTQPTSTTGSTYNEKYALTYLLLMSNIGLFKDLAKDPLSKNAPEALLSVARSILTIFVNNTLFRIRPTGEIYLAENNDELLKKQTLEKIELAFSTGSKKMVFGWVENIRGLMLFSEKKDLSLLHTSFYGNADLVDAEAKLPDLKFVFDSDFIPSSEDRFFTDFYQFYVLPPKFFPGRVPSIMEWKTHYGLQESSGRPAYLQSANPFQVSWKATGEKGIQKKVFKTWFESLKRTAATTLWEKLHKQAKKSSRARLWETFSSLEELEKSPVFANLEAFFERWDKNAAYASTNGTYQMFLALLRESIDGAHKAASFEAGPLRGNTDIEISGYLPLLMKLIPVRMDDFNSWEDIVKDDKLTQTEDWITLAQGRRAVSAIVGERRQFSNLIGANDIEYKNTIGLHRQATYHPFPTGLHDDEDLYQTPKDFKQWVAPALDAAKTVVWRSFEPSPTVTSWNKETPGNTSAYKRLVQDGLELQDEYEIQNRENALSKNKLPTRNRKLNFGDNFELYFSKANIPSGERKKDLENIFKTVFSDLPAEKAIQKGSEILKIHLDYVALEKISNEGLNEKQTNALLKTFAQRVAWTLEVPQIKALGNIKKPSEELTAQLTYIARNMAYAQMLLGKSEAETKSTEQLLASVRAYYQLQAEQTTYYEDLVASMDRAYKNLELLCSEAKFEGRISNEADLKKHKDRILEIGLPQMSGLMKHIDKVAPRAEAESASRLLKQVLLNEEKEIREAKQWENVIQWSLVGMMAMNGASRIAGSASQRVMTTAWGRAFQWLAGTATSFIGSRTASYALGGYFLYQTYDGLHDDFVAEPARYERYLRVRNSTVEGKLPLMTDEEAALDTTLQKNVSELQWNKWSWAGRALNIVISWNSFIVPTWNTLRSPSQAIRNLNRWRTWAMEVGPWNRLLKSSQAYRSATKDELMIRSQQLAQSGFGELGVGFANELEMKTQKIHEQVMEGLRRFVDNKMFGKFSDGYWIPSKNMSRVLAEDIQKQIQNTLMMADLNPRTLEPLTKASVQLAKEEIPWVLRNEKWIQAWEKQAQQYVQMQSDARSQVLFLQQMESRLLSSTPHISVEEIVRVLGGKGSVAARHSPYLMQMFGLNVPTLNPFRYAQFYQLSRLNAAIKAGMDVEHGMAYYLLDKWMNNNIIGQNFTTVGDSKVSLVELLQKELGLSGPQALQFAIQQNVNRPEVRKALEELNDILRLTGMAPTPELLQAISQNDTAVLLKLFYQNQGKALLSFTQSQFLKPEPSTNGSTPLIESSSARFSAKEAMEYAPVEPNIPGAEIYKEFMISKLASENINAELAAELALKYSSQNLKRGLGEGYIARFGTRLNGEAKELRIAAEYRQAIEIELSSFDYNNTDRLGQISSFFDALYHVHLKDTAALLNKSISVQESMGVFKMPSNLRWNESEVTINIVIAEEEKVHQEAIEKASQILIRCSKQGRKTFSGLDHLSEITELPTEYLKNHKILEKVMGPLTKQLGPDTEEGRFLQKLFFKE